ncbi:MAG: aminotransferase class I/II-fold pyridoxal phosphate-dependent enzyme [Cyanobacteria bacterium P01_H01_bin.74]
MPTSPVSSNLEFSIKDLYSDYCKNMKTYIMFRIAAKVAELGPALTEKNRSPIKMSIGAPTVSPPKVLLDYFREQLSQPGIHTYSVPKGEPFFLEAITTRMRTRFGVNINPKTEATALIGSKEGLANMFRAIVTPKPDFYEKDIILTPDPGYASYVDAINVAGGLSYPTPLTMENKYLPDLDMAMANLEKDGHSINNVKALIINYPSNPIGATAPFSYYEKVVAFAQKHQILLISDIAYSEMYFEGEEAPHSILEVEGAKELAIEFHSMSKPYAMTGWRIGFAVGNADAVSILAKVKGTQDSGIFRAFQKAASFALGSAECDAYIKENNKMYAKNQQFMLEGFKKLGWPIDDMIVPKATFYFWLPIPRAYNSCEQFAEEVLEKSGVVLVPGTAFGKMGEGYVRLSLVNPQSELNEVINRFETDGFTY